MKLLTTGSHRRTGTLHRLSLYLQSPRRRSECGVGQWGVDGDLSFDLEWRGNSIYSSFRMFVWTWT